MRAVGESRLSTYQIEMMCGLDDQLIPAVLQRHVGHVSVIHLHLLIFFLPTPESAVGRQLVVAGCNILE